MSQDGRRQAREQERLLELLAVRALISLSPEEGRELDTLLGSQTDIDPGIFDRIAAAIAIARCHDLILPEPLARRLESDAAEFFGLTE